MKFNPDSPFFQFMNTLASFIALNVLFLLTCLPVITIGPALCALYDVTMQEARGEYGYLIRSYFRSFWKNLRKGILLFLLLAAFGMILLFNLVFWYQMNTVSGTIISFVLTLAAGAYLFILLYVFALTARFENSLKETLKNSFLLAVNYKKQTILLFLLPAAAIGACIIMHQAKIFMILVGFSFLVYCQAFLLNQVFKNYLESPEVSAFGLLPNHPE